MKLHLGCGKRHIPGYFHIDAIEFPHVDLVHEIDRLPMVLDDSIEIIYTCHTLEHFFRRDAQRVLSEWRRVLRPGGTLRVAVPDFEALVELYQKTGKLEHVIGPIFGRGDYLYNLHRNLFDYRTLNVALTDAGFRDVQRYDWKTTDHASVDDYSQSFYPHLDRSGLLLSLNVEATK